MPTSTKVKNLNINELTEAQYDAAVQGGVIGANELSVLTDVNYAELGDLATVATTGDYSDLINRPTNLVSTNTAQTISGLKTFSGDITLSGTTSIKNNTGGTNYTMLYRDATTIHVGASTSVLKLEGSGTRPAYNNDSLALLSDITGGLPDQTGNAGKFLTTDGTDASWSHTVSKNVLNYRNEIDVLTLKTVSGIGTSTVHIGTMENDLYLHPAIGGNIRCFSSPYPKSPTNSSLGLSTAKWERTYTTKLNNGNDITVPTVAGSMAVQVSSMPTADSTLEGQIYQFTGMTDATYTHGHLYECVSDGQDPATYSWTEVQLGGGGSSYTAGTGIDITSGVISVTAPTLQNTATGQYALTILGSATTQTRATNIGYNATAVDYGTSVGYNARAGVGGVAIGDNANNSNKMRSTALGNQTVTNGEYAIAIGWDCGANADGAIQIGGKVGVSHSNTDANTLKVGNANGNYEMMSADGTIPTARLTKVNTTITLAAADWSSNTQTVSVTGMTADGVVMVSPAPADQSAYTSAGVLCTAQAAGSLTFTCDTVPSGDLSVNMVML